MVHRRHSLLVGLIVTTVVVTLALSWAGWRLIQQQRAIDRQRAQEQLGAAADSMAAAIRGKLAETGERLSQATTNPDVLPAIAGAAALTFQPDGTARATGGLPFVPAVPDTAAADALFEDAEVLEFPRADLAAASSRYHALIRHSDPAIRAGALVRYARVAEKRGDTAAALGAYRQLEQAGDVRFKHLPVRFIGLYQQRAIAKARGDAERERTLAATLTQGLDAGEWLLTREAAAWYRDQLEMQHVPATWALAEAVERVWQTDGATLPPRGQRVINDGARSILVMWRATRSATAMMTAYFDEFLPATSSNVTWHLADPAGRWIAGERSMPSDTATPRVVGDSEYAWMLHVGGLGMVPTVNRGEQTIVAMTAAMLAFLWGAMYFMARAIRRETAVARLQTDFVAAVSHEFRSPLTSIRQMAEMLEADRVPSSERRREYYQVLAGEATRLQRLVETLLNFGRMEAGAARYKLEELDMAHVVRRVVDDIDQVGATPGRRITVTGRDNDTVVNADASALAVAIRNVIDNAVKYSPEGTDVRVEWGQNDGRAHVRVIDIGIGIPRAEQQTIFEKFVRGRAAIDGNVAGTGVGLAMVRQILRAHGGDIVVESEVGHGSTFTLTLPLAHSRQADLKVGPYQVGPSEIGPYEASGDPCEDSSNEDSSRGRPSGPEDAVVRL